MQLAQDTRAGERGYAMAGLLVALAIMSLMLSVAMPTWRTMMQREKEAELIWRGQQYDRAIQLYRRKTGAPGAPSIDALVEGRYLRKKFKDPITGDDFEVVPLGAVPSGPGVPQQPRAYGQLVGGVRSRSKDRSLRVLNGRSRYNEWQFTYVPWKPGGQPTVPGAPGDRTPAGGQGPGGRSGFGSPSPSTRPPSGQSSSPFSPR